MGSLVIRRAWRQRTAIGDTVNKKTKPRSMALKNIMFGVWSIGVDSFESFARRRTNFITLSSELDFGSTRSVQILNSVTALSGKSCTRRTGATSGVSSTLVFHSKKRIWSSKRHSSLVAAPTFSPSDSSSFPFLPLKNKSGNMPRRQPMVTPKALPPFAAILDDDNSSCSMVRGGGAPQPSLVSQYSTYQADLERKQTANVKIKRLFCVQGHCRSI